MTHPKFTALAHQVTERRLQHRRTLETSEQPGEDHFYLSVSEEEPGRQLLLAFQGQARHIEVFHRFDPHRREVEWSYYTPEGEFLLEFAFSLKDLSYWIYSIHPMLLAEKNPMSPYRRAINHHLQGRYPALQLVKDGKGEPAIHPVKAEAFL